MPSIQPTHKKRKYFPKPYYMMKQRIKITNKRNILKNIPIQTTIERTITMDTADKENVNTITSCHQELPLALQNDTVQLPPAIFDAFFHKGDKSKLIERIYSKCAGTVIFDLHTYSENFEVKIECMKGSKERILESLQEFVKKEQKCMVERTTLVEYMVHDRTVWLEMGAGGSVVDVQFPEYGTTLVVYILKENAEETWEMLKNNYQNNTHMFKYDRLSETKLHKGSKYFAVGEMNFANVQTTQEEFYKHGELHSNHKDKYFLAYKVTNTEGGVKFYLTWDFEKNKTMIVRLVPRKSDVCPFRIPKFMNKINFGDKWCQCSLVDSDTIKVDITGTDWQVTYQHMKLHVQQLLTKTSRHLEAVEFIGCKQQKCSQAHLDCMHKYIEEKMDLAPKDYDIKMKGIGVGKLEASCTVRKCDNKVIEKFQAAVRESEAYTFGKLVLQKMDFVRVSITKGVYHAVEEGIKILEESMLTRKGHTFRLEQFATNDRVYIDICAEDKSLIPKIRKVLHTITSAHTITDIQPMEMWYLSGPEGKHQCKRIEQRHHVKIMLEKASISIYGPKESKHLAMDNIVDIVSQIRENTLKIHINANQLNSLHQIYGKNLKRIHLIAGVRSVYVDQRGPAIYVYGSKSGSQTAHSQIIRAMHAVPQESLVTCVACFSSPCTSHTLSLCGHAYCECCLAMQVRVCLESATLPVICAADNCGMPVSWPDISCTLSASSSTSTRNFLKSALDLYIIQNPGVILYCPTPDCKMIYPSRDTASDLKYSCTACLHELCAKCLSKHHEGLSCDQYRTISKIFPNLSAWMEADINNRSVCPVCHHGIEKNGGCPHLQCMACKTCICWKCKQFFPTSSKAYTHISKCDVE